MGLSMADKKFLDAMKNKFSEDPTDKRTTFYNMGGWKQSERKSAFVKEGKEIAEKRHWYSFRSKGFNVLPIIYY